MTYLCGRCRGRVIQEFDELVCLCCGRRLPVAVLDGWKPLDGPPPAARVEAPVERPTLPRSRRKSDRLTCPYGHPYDEVNTYRDPAGWRHCRACSRERDRDYHRRQRQVALASVRRRRRRAA